MIVKFHRWQPRTNRYQTQTKNLANGRNAPYMDLLCGIDSAKKFNDPSVKQVIARTHRIDRVLCNFADSGDGTGVALVEVFMSPVIIRKYEKSTRRVSESNVKLPSGCACLQFQLTGEHDSRCPAFETTVKESN